MTPSHPTQSIPSATMVTASLWATLKAPWACDQDSLKPRQRWKGKIEQVNKGWEEKNEGVNKVKESEKSNRLAKRDGKHRSRVFPVNVISSRCVG